VKDTTKLGVITLAGVVVLTAFITRAVVKRPRYPYSK
jgi:hypothetical protein